MDFATAEEKFNELQARIRRGEPMSEDQYQEELAQLMVQDDTGVFWSLEPGTGRWLYFNGTEWVPGMPPRQAAPPPPTPVYTPPVVETPAYEPPSYQAPTYTEPASYQPPSYTEPASYQPPSYTEPASYQPPSYAETPSAEPVAETPPSYYVPSDVTRPIEYSGSFTGAPSYEEGTGASSYVPLTDAGAGEPEALPTYVRMPEPETTGAPTGGIPPRPVREASPLAIPGGERAWLPFAFGALVLLLCAVVLFFGVRGLPQFAGSPATDPTDEPTEQVTDVLPTETVQLMPTDAPEPTEEATPEPPPTPEPQPVTAAATDVLNIRQGPARTTPSLGKLQPGQSVTVIGRNGDGTWLQIEIPPQIASGTGWVSADFVTINGDVNTLPVTSGESGSNPQPQETPAG